ncbi:hypothetical protein V8E55_003746 [Tylopilus felleus]
MQFIWFRSVIRTIWVVNDGETNKITLTFYKCMVDESASGRLDHTRGVCVEQDDEIPIYQRILCIHLGA